MFANFQALTFSLSILFGLALLLLSQQFFVDKAVIYFDHHPPEFLLSSFGLRLALL